MFDEFADALDRQVSDLADPAEIISVSVRHTLRRAQRGPVWGQFLIREGFTARALDRGLGWRLVRDIRNGITAQRFTIADPVMGLMAVGGTVLASVAAELQMAAPREAPTAKLAELGFTTEKLPERSAAVVLQTLGISPAEAEQIANRPLPAVK